LEAKVLLNSIVSLTQAPLANFLFFYFSRPTNPLKREGDGNQTFYGDGVTSEALQYQFSITSKQVQEH